MTYIRQKDLPRYREDNKPDECPIVGVSDFDPVVDHCHQSGFIRGVIDREANAFLGRIENAYWRMSLKVREKSLPQMLRAMADYLEQQPARDIHPTGFRQLYKRFSYFTKREQEKLIFDAGGSIDELSKCKNAIDRQKLYKKVLRLS